MNENINIRALSDAGKMEKLIEVLDTLIILDANLPEAQLILSSDINERQRLAEQYQIDGVGVDYNNENMLLINTKKIKKIKG